MTKKPGAKRQKVTMHAKFYKKTLKSVAAMRAENARGDAKLFRQVWRLEQRLKKSFKHVEGATFEVSLTEIQAGLLKFAVENYA